MTEQPTPADTEQVFPDWYHRSQLDCLRAAIDGDVAQRAILVEWIAQIDERVAKNTVEAQHHAQVLVHRSLAEDVNRLAKGTHHESGKGMGGHP